MWWYLFYLFPNLGHKAFSHWKLCIILTFLLSPFQYGLDVPRRINWWGAVLKRGPSVESKSSKVCLHTTQIRRGCVCRVGCLSVDAVCLKQIKIKLWNQNRHLKNYLILSLKDIVCKTYTMAAKTYLEIYHGFKS